METDTMEFLADSEGDWFFHCHILYHMMSGMNRVFSYKQQDTNPLLPNKKSAYKKLQRKSNTIHVMAENDFAFNGNDGMAMLQNARWQFGTEWRLGYNSMHGFETETQLGRYLGKMQWAAVFIGLDWQYRRTKNGEIDMNMFGQDNGTGSRARASLGFQYTLPMLLVFQAKAQHNGNVRLQLSRDDIPISRRFRTGFMVNTDYEYMVDLRCILTKNISLRGHYDSDMGPGVGLTLMY
jgi:hypothetical protein